MRPVAFRLSSAPDPHRIVSTAPRIEVIVSPATDVSTADTARIAAIPESLSAAQPVPVARGNRDQTRLSMMEQ
jgi:hypothetical protein